MEPDLLGIDRLVEDIGDQLIGAAPVVDIMVVAQCEIPELHHLSPLPDRYGASLIGRSAVHPGRMSSARHYAAARSAPGSTPACATACISPDGRARCNTTSPRSC